MLKNVQRSWKMLKKVEKCWQKLKNVEKCWSTVDQHVDSNANSTCWSTVDQLCWINSTCWSTFANCWSTFCYRFNMLINFWSSYFNFRINNVDQQLINMLTLINMLINSWSTCWFQNQHVDQQLINMLIQKSTCWSTLDRIEGSM